MSAQTHVPIELARDCAAILIPGGRAVTLSQGDWVVLVQALGGSLTVQIDRGRLARVDAKDADALGIEVAEIDQATGDGARADHGNFDVEQVMERLRTVFDPEIPVNVVDLGLVYACEARPLVGGGHRVEIKMSMTAPGCGMGDVLREDARVRVSKVPGVSEVDVELVWEPPWDTSRMSEAARLELGLW